MINSYMVPRIPFKYEYFLNKCIFPIYVALIGS